MGGIGGILGAIALLGFLLFLAGIGPVVVSVSQGRPARSGVTLAVIGLVGGILLSIVSQGILVVQPTEVAVVFNVLSGDLEEPRGPGTHIIIPVIQEVTIYPTLQQQYTVSGVASEGQVQGNDAVRGRSTDGQEVFLDITVIFRIDPIQVDATGEQNANKVHRLWQTRYQNEFIRPTLRSVARDALSLFRAEEIFGVRRDELQRVIAERMTEAMVRDGFSMTDLLVRDVTFTSEFAASIENKQIAEQNRLRQQQESDRVRIEADGRRDAEIARAQGESQAIVLRAVANAEALRLVSEQIAANPNLIQYLYVQNLSDNVSLALIPTNSPFLFDFNSFTEMGSDFVAPEVPDVTLPEADTGDSSG